ncbi:DUF7537 family lipoprotein [Halococcus salifodinae]|uniref:DUF7537 family lipoprotein n=1 Tax=Halococcus salifodinae TaxID=36738 RepID=UPI003F836F19
MNRSQVFAIAVAVVVVLSGCNALTGSDTETDTPTVTPAAVPTDEPTPTPMPMLAPGLTQAGVVSVSELANAHEDALDNNSHTVVSNNTVRYENDTLRHQLNRTMRVAEGSEPFYAISRYNGSGRQPVVTSQRIERWSEGEQLYSAIVRENETRYSISALNRVFISVQNRDQFIKLFNALETRVVGQETRNGTELYRVRATNISNPEYLPRSVLNTSKNPQNISFRALVDSEGIVRSYYLGYTTTEIKRRVNTTNRVTQSLRYTDIGSTTVERPAWYEAANRTTTAAE